MIVFRDFFFLGPQASREGGPSSSPDVRMLASGSKGLRVKMSASHASRKTRNHTFYPPFTFKNSSHTFIHPYPRPVQVHHDDHADPIGRLIGARYVSYDGQQLSHKDEKVRDICSFIDAASTPKAIFEGIDLLDAAGVLGDPEWAGTGELELESLITDQAAIEKILDGRYMTVSVSMDPLQAYCSSCHKDWVADSPCEHQPGTKDEDGKLVMLVSGDIIGREVSYINQPADELAGNKELTVVSTQDNLAVPYSSIDSTEHSRVVYEIVDSFGAGIAAMPKPDDQVTEIEPQEETPDVVVQDGVTPTDPIQDEVIPTPEPAPVLEDSVVVTDEIVPELPEDETPEEVLPTLDQALEMIFSDPDSMTEDHEAVIRQAVLEEAEKEALEAQDEVALEDAKLTTKKRKSLPSKTFCGPGRSFPVPDCAHVVAARRLIGRYKGPGDKSAILACVARKAKALGCPSAKKSSDEVEPQAEVCVDCQPDEEVLAKYSEYKEIVDARGLLEPVVCEECKTWEGQVLELNSQLDALRTEYKLLLTDTIAADDALQEMTSRLEAIVRDSARFVKLVCEKETPAEEIEISIVETPIEDLERLLTDADKTSVVEFIRSGLANEPEPQTTVTIEDALETPAEESIEQIADENLREISRKLVKLASRSEKVADEYLRELKIFGKIDREFTLDDARVIVAE